MKINSERSIFQVHCLGNYLRQNTTKQVTNNTQRFGHICNWIPVLLYTSVWKITSVITLTHLKRTRRCYCLLLRKSRHLFLNTTDRISIWDPIAAGRWNEMDLLNRLTLFNTGKQI